MKKLLSALLFLSTVTFFSCAKKADKSMAGNSSAVHQEAKGADEDFAVAGYKSQATVQTSERKIIFTGSISLEVKSLEKTQDAVQKWVSDFGGYIAESSMNSRNADFTAKIPAASFEDAMEKATTFGSILRKEVESTDVTDEFYDLKTRLETKRVLLERLQTYLKNASAIKDMMEIEDKINDVTGDLEAMQGQMNRLSNKIDFATVTISARLPVNHTEEGFALPDAKSKAKTLFGGFLNFLVNLIFVLLYIVFYGIPIVLALALFYWLCFGKVGLVKKLFRKVSGKK